MLVPGFPGITLKEILSLHQPDASLPFPLNRVQRSAFSNKGVSSPVPSTLNPEPFFYYFARNGIYHGLRYFGIQPGDEVLMPELNSTIEPQVVRALGAIPVFYKILVPDTLIHDSRFMIHEFSPDWDDAESKITPRTKVFQLIHYLGVPNDIEGTLEFCKKHNLIFFEDAAYGFLSAFSVQRSAFSNKGVSSPVPSTLNPEPYPLGSFGDFSILCPRKTVPVPNGGILVINTKSRNHEITKNTSRNIVMPEADQPLAENSKYPSPPLPPISSSIHPFQASYSSLWDWQYLLRNNPSPVIPDSDRESKNKNKKQKDLDPTSYKLQVTSFMKRFLKDPYYTFHGSGTFNLKHVNWGMTKMAYNQLLKFDYQTNIQKNLENYKYVRDYCVNRGWDIFPREIPHGTVPNAILLRIRKDQKYNVIPNHQPSSQSFIWDPETKNKKQKDLNGLRVTGYVLREDRPTKDVINNFADWVSQEMLKHGIQLARPWCWNENISTLKDIPSVDAYVGRGLILPIYYQLTRTHLDYYLSLLSSLLSS